MPVELLELTVDELVLPGRVLRVQPEHPVPEMRVERCEVLAVRAPRRVVEMRLVRGEQIDLSRGTGGQQVTPRRAEAVPLLGQRLLVLGKGRQTGGEAHP